MASTADAIPQSRTARRRSAKPKPALVQHDQVLGQEYPGIFGLEEILLSQSNRFVGGVQNVLPLNRHKRSHDIWRDLNLGAHLVTRGKQHLNGHDGLIVVPGQSVDRKQCAVFWAVQVFRVLN